MHHAEVMSELRTSTQPSAHSSPCEHASERTSCASTTAVNASDSVVCSMPTSPPDWHMPPSDARPTMYESKSMPVHHMNTCTHNPGIPLKRCTVWNDVLGGN